MKFDFKNFAVKCKKELTVSDYRNMSLRTLGNEWGLSAPTLSRLFKGNRADIDTVITACFYLDIMIDDYFI